MIVSIHIEYEARWGEQIYLCVGAKPHEGDALPADAVALNNDGRGHWFTRVEAAWLSGGGYHYLLARSGRVVRTEWGDGHRLGGGSKGRRPPTLHLFDAWRDNPADLPFFSSAFTQSIFGHPAVRAAAGAPRVGERYTLTIECEAATVRKGQVLAVCGNTAALGDWNPQAAAVMDATAQPRWSLTVRRDAITFPLLYKFVILDEATRALVAWEPGCDRYFDPGTLQEGDAVWVRNLRFTNPQHPWRGAGVAIPVFSLRSRDSFGIGEFSDIRLLVDWAERTGMSVIQLLPVNDTTATHTWRDSYPYRSTSSFALNPMYIRLQELDHAHSALTTGVTFRKMQEQLNRQPAVDYEAVQTAKWECLRRLFSKYGAKDLASRGYAAFYARNAYWLDPYAAFCCLRDRYATSDFTCWRERTYTPDLPARLATTTIRAHEMDFHKYIQYHLHRQLAAARDYAHAHGIILKGDIPIGISRHSADAWVHGAFFRLDSQAGAPPDAFDRRGQNWGFPTYDWPALAADGYRWFRERFAKMSDYFDAYRIDHILGFFRIWEIPDHAIQGLLGHFSPALPLTPAEMATEYGFKFDYARHVLPYVTDDVLDTLFEGDESIITLVKGKFLEPICRDGKHYTFCPRFATQHGVDGYFRKRDTTDHTVRDGLYTLLTNVLFVEDPRAAGHYHPRINGMETTSFEALTPAQQQAYRTLHDDFFYHRHDDYWREEAMRKLPALIRATDMLACGEDLGMIPSCVPEVMRELRILSLEVQRMPKGFEEFGHPERYPYYSVCTTSSHDLSNIRAWWEEDRARTCRYYTTILQGIGDPPATAEPWICSKIIQDHLNSPAMLAILPLQDWLSIDATLRYPHPEEERINVPANPDNYWHYRMHLTLEELLAATDFADRVAAMVRKYDR